MSKMRLSIIVPMYNVENYIFDCLHSLLTQDLSANEYEILVINDCCTDQSLTITNEIAAIHDNIKVISHEKNLGLSRARNTGIKYAIGNFIIFIDSDDMITANSLGNMIDICECNSLDVLMCNLARHVDVHGNFLRDDSQSILGRSILRDDKKVFNGKEYLSMSTYNDGCVSFFFRNEFLKHHDFIFENKIYFEDLDLLYKVLYKTKRMMAIKSSHYLCRNRPDSITRHSNLQKFKKSLQDMVFVLDRMQNFIDVNLTKEPRIRKHLQKKQNVLAINALALSRNTITNRTDAEYFYRKLQSINAVPIKFNFYKGMSLKNRIAYYLKYSRTSFIKSFLS